MRKMVCFVMAFAMVLGFTQCKKDQPEPQNEGEGNQVRISLNVNGGDNGSRVIVDPNGATMVTFEEGDKIIVSNGGKYLGYLEHNGTTFTGSITNPTEGQPLYFYFLGNKLDVSQLNPGETTSCPPVNISDQTNELPIISMGESLDAYGNPLNYTTGMTSFTAKLHNHCSLMKFNVDTPSTAPICITGMCNTVTVSFYDNHIGEAFQDNGLIMMKGVTSENTETWAVVLAQEALEEGEGVHNSTYSTTGLLYTADHFYSGTRPAIHEIKRGYKYDGDNAITMEANTDTYNALETPLTFEARTAGAKVAFNNYYIGEVSKVEFSTNGGASWSEYDYNYEVTLTNVGDKVMFRGSNNYYATSSTDNYCYFSCSDDCYVYGNVMSLIDKNNFATATTLTYVEGKAVFKRLFYQNTKIDIPASKDLVLPATTITSSCYMFMFYGCTGLTKTPYQLPAMTLEYSCYSDMFSGCSNITTAPVLPAPTLTTYCYSNMFHGCTKLSNVTCLATSTTDNDFTRINNWWLDGVASTGTFTKAANSINWPSGGQTGIPTGWTVETYSGK